MNEKLDKKQFFKELENKIKPTKNDILDMEFLKNESRAYAQYKNYYMGKSLFETINKLNLTQIPMFITNSNVGKSYFSEFWFVLSDLQEYLLKQIVSHRFIKDGNQSRVIENAMIIPEIVRQCKCESAQYYITEYFDDNGYSDEYLVTPSFLKKEEELLSFTHICGENEMEIPNMQYKLCEYFRLRHFSTEQIKKLERDFIKTMFISKLIENKDEHSENISVIIYKKSVKMAPFYDYDYCCGNERIKSNIERKVNGKSDLSSFVDYYINEKWFRQWLENVILNLNVDTAIEQKNLKKNKAVIDEKYYIDFFEQKKNILAKALLEKQKNAKKKQGANNEIEIILER